MAIISKKSLSVLVKGLIEIQRDITQIKFHISILKDGKCYNNKLNRIIPLSNDELLKKDYWLKNNKKLLKEQEKYEIEYKKAIRNKVK